MIEEVFKRAFGWWLLAEDICIRLTMPPMDVAASDRQFERLLRESWLWSSVENLAGKIRGGWLDSMLRSWTVRVRDERPADPAGNVLALPAIASVMRISAATTLAVQALKPAGSDPLSWCVPVAVGIGGLILPWVASRIPRATESEKP